MNPEQRQALAELEAQVKSLDNNVAVLMELIARHARNQDRVLDLLDRCVRHLEAAP